MLSGRLEGKSIISERHKNGSPNFLHSIADALIRIATNPLIKAEIPFIDRYLDLLIETLRDDDYDAVERALTDLYVILHSAGSRYSEEEKATLRAKGGYHCYPGGLSPLILAGHFIKEDTVTADLGAGNGLQGLLLQELYPHKKTIQIEIAREMIRIGRLFQNALGIGIDRIEWINDDIMQASFDGVDLIYIYRPARPQEGAALYRNIADRLSAIKRDITLFSIADCLSPYLQEPFVTCYDDGHLKIMVNYEVSPSVSHSLIEDLPFL